MSPSRFLVSHSKGKGSCDAKSACILGPAAEAVALWIYREKIIGIPSIPQIQVASRSDGIPKTLIKWLVASLA